jgi:hypothetical protein
MVLEEASLIGETPALGAAVNTKALITLGIYGIGAVVLYKLAGALAKKGGLT